MLWAQKEDGHFHNNFAYDRSKEPETPSDDCLGRCLWACARAMAAKPSPSFAFAAESIFRKALGQAHRMRYPRGWAYALAAFGLLQRSGYDVDLTNRIRKPQSALPAFITGIRLRIGHGTNPKSLTATPCCLGGCCGPMKY
ncbi:hypothetical protein VQ056_15360 [Paenibacillus sp. JTLBN-2024]